MTTVTERLKRSSDGELLSGVERAPGDALELARRLAGFARELNPAREWSVEDLHDLLHAAVHGAGNRERVLDGRHFRKRLREQWALFERHRDRFAVVVARLATDDPSGVLAEVLATRLRESDLAFPYRRRVALLLPRMSAAGLERFADRVILAAEQAAGPGVIQSVAAIAVPDPAAADLQALLDWAEDQIRDEP